MVPFLRGLGFCDPASHLAGPALSRVAPSSQAMSSWLLALPVAYLPSLVLSLHCFHVQAHIGLLVCAQRHVLVSMPRPIPV